MNSAQVRTVVAVLVLSSGAVAHAAEEAATPTPAAAKTTVQVNGDGSVHVKSPTGQVDVGSDGSVHVNKRGRTVDVQPGVGVAVETNPMPGSPAEDLRGEALMENGRKATYDCHGRSVTVYGNGNSYAFLHCASVQVAGNDNKVQLRAGAEVVDVAGNDNAVSADALVSVTVAGNDNRINWAVSGATGTTTISNLGKDNDVRPDSR